MALRVLNLRIPNLSICFHRYQSQDVSTEAELQAAFDIRDKVFVREQGIPNDMERDEHDAGYRQVLANCGDSPVATAELGYSRCGGEEIAGPHRLIKMEKQF